MMHEHLHPTKCFCQIPESELRKWAIKKFKERCSTAELLNSTTDPLEREAISAVALLDVDQETMLQLMGDVDLPEHHIIHCRDKIKKLLSFDNIALDNN